jgi:ribosome-binding protein aMBF1 (putative translation factor)
MKRLTLREARDKKGWTQEQLEAATERLGNKVDQRNISKMESEVNTDPKNRTVEVLERALGLKRGTLVFGQRFQAAS